MLHSQVLTEIASFIERYLPANGVYTTAFTDSAKPEGLKANKATLESIRNEIEKGWFQLPRALISAEIFSDQLTVAEEFIRTNPDGLQLSLSVSR